MWFFDTAAYLAGSLIGGPRLLPKISPNKTWAGLFGGCIAIGATSFFVAKLFINTDIEALDLVVATVFIGIVGQVGDFMESYFKRKFNVKDSGNILPGHGGVLDRLDSIFLAAILFFIMIYG
jgi:phosphatidate cytidylyltransferase